MRSMSMVCALAMGGHTRWGDCTEHGFEEAAMVVRVRGLHLRAHWS